MAQVKSQLQNQSGLISSSEKTIDEQIQAAIQSQKDVAKIIYGEMSKSDHPGVDIWAYLIRGGVPYEETAVS